MKKEKKKKFKMDYSDIAWSEYLNKFVKSGLTSLMESHNLKSDIHLDLIYEEASDVTAYTDGDQCVVNCAFPLLHQNTTNGKTVNIPEREYMYRILGIVFHEFGHVIYTDFSEKKRSAKAIRSGTIQMPRNLNTEEISYYKELSDVLKGNSSDLLVCAIRQMIINVFLALNNIVEDGRIERLLHKNDSWFSGYVKGLDSLNEAMRMSHVGSSIKKDINGYMDCILDYVKFGEVYGYSGDFPEFEKAKPIADRMLCTEASSTLMEETIRLMLYMWPLLKEEIEKLKSMGENKDGGINGENGEGQNSESSESNNGNAENNSGSSEGNSSGESSSGESLENAIENAVSEMSEEAKRKLQHEIQKISNHAEDLMDKSLDKKVPKKAKANNELDQKQKESGTGSSQQMGNLLNQIKKDVNQKKNYENALKDSENFYDPEIVKKAGKPIFINRYNPGVNNDPLVDEILKRAKRENMRSSRQIARYLEEDARTRISKRKYSGKKFHAEKLVNRDFRYFENSSSSREVPKISVGIVLDQSGSMTLSSKAENAMKSVISLWQLLDGVPNMDIAVIGHSENILRQYMTFGDKPKNAVYAFSTLMTDVCGWNMDALAISSMTAILDKQETEKKIQIIVSDGLPHPITGKPVKVEIQDLLLKNKKKGITTIAVAITGDESEWEQFQDIYENVPIIKVDNPAKLSKQMVSIVKRFV